VIRQARTAARLPCTTDWPHPNPRLCRRRHHRRDSASRRL